MLCPQTRQEVSDERRYSKSQRDHQDSDMKSFVAQQKADFKSTKAVFKKQLDEDTGLSSAQRKQVLDDRKRELLGQQKVNEEEHLRILKAIAEQKLVEYKQKELQDRQNFEKELLQQVSADGRYFAVTTLTTSDGWLCCRS